MQRNMIICMIASRAYFLHLDSSWGFPIHPRRAALSPEEEKTPLSRHQEGEEEEEEEEEEMSSLMSVPCFTSPLSMLPSPTPESVS